MRSSRRSRLSSTPAMAAVRLHRAIFAEGASKLILKQIDGAQLPHALHADGDTLLAAISALLSLALRTPRGLAPDGARL